MLCKKCKKELQDDWLYCPWCGLNAKKDSRRAISQRKDGTYQKAITIDGKRKYFYGRSEKDVIKKIAEFSREAEDKRSAAFAVYAEALEQSWDNLAYCALPGFVDSKNEEKTERNAGYLVVSHSGGGMLRQGTREGIRRTPANRGMRAHRVVKGLDISEDVCHGLCP